MLHLITTATQLPSPATIAQHDGIVLLSEGVLLLMNVSESFMSDIPSQVTCFVIKADLQARGYNPNNDHLTSLRQSMKLIDYHDLVKLTLQYDKTLTW